MTPDQLVEFELSKLDWSSVAEISGPATAIPTALRELLIFAPSADDATRAYWQLENHVVVQGQLFEAAIHVVPVILAALLPENRPRFVRIGLLELLFQIVNGVTHEVEVNRGLGDIGIRCKLAARSGLWLLYREAFFGHHAAAIDILEAIDDDDLRIQAIKSRP